MCDLKCVRAFFSTLIAKWKREMLVANFWIMKGKFQEALDWKAANCSHTHLWICLASAIIILWSLALLKLTVNTLELPSMPITAKLLLPVNLLFDEAIRLEHTYWLKIIEQMTKKNRNESVSPNKKVPFNSRLIVSEVSDHNLCSSWSQLPRTAVSSGEIINSAPVTLPGFILARSKINTRRPAGFLHWKIVMSHACRHIRRWSNRPN